MSRRERRKQQGETRWKNIKDFNEALSHAKHGTLSALNEDELRECVAQGLLTQAEMDKQMDPKFRSWARARQKETLASKLSKGANTMVDGLSVIRQELADAAEERTERKRLKKIRKQEKKDRKRQRKQLRSGGAASLRGAAGAVAAFGGLSATTAKRQSGVSAMPCGDEKEAATPVASP